MAKKKRIIKVVKFRGTGGGMVRLSKWVSIVKVLKVYDMLCGGSILQWIVYGGGGVFIRIITHRVSIGKLLAL